MRAHVHREPRDLGDAAGDQAGARVETKAKALGRAGGDRDHVLERAADLDADEVFGGVNAKTIGREQRLDLNGC